MDTNQSETTIVLKNKQMKTYLPKVILNGFKIAVLTPTEKDFKKYLKDHVEVDNQFLYHKVSKIDDCVLFRYYYVVDGYYNEKVSLDVHRRARMRT